MKSLPFLLAGIALPAFISAQVAPQVRSITVQPGVEVALEFTDTSVGGVRYTLEASDGLVGWTEVGSELPDILGTGLYGMLVADRRGDPQVFPGPLRAGRGHAGFQNPRSGGRRGLRRAGDPGPLRR